MIIALAGRRIDAPDSAVPRFPLHNVPMVRGRIRRFFAIKAATSLVCSGACGADLLALDTAAELGLHRRVILPFEPDQFRQSSVIDRPGVWGSLFDQIVVQVKESGNLVVLHEAGDWDTAFANTNRCILDDAIKLAKAKESNLSGISPRTPNSDHRRGQIIAVIVWDGVSRGEADFTAGFAREAMARQVPLFTILTT